MNRRRGDRVQGRRTYGGVLVIPCQVNDAYRYWFLADTGTAMTMLSQQVAEEIGLDLAHPVRFQRMASVHQVTQAPILRLTSLQVGGQRLTDIESWCSLYHRICGWMGFWASTS